MPGDPGSALAAANREQGGDSGIGASQGMFWLWELDFDSMQAALADPAPWGRSRPVVSGADADGGDADGEDADGEDADEGTDQEALLGVTADGVTADGVMADEVMADEAPLPTSVVAGRIVESLPVGPVLAGWLAAAKASELEDGALAGVAASFRRLASWAQAGELAAVAQIASRAAARDERVGVADDGRPSRVPASACSEVALGLVMSEYGASWWTDLGVTLNWRLLATGAALRDGQIDLYRARLIAEQTTALDDDAARAVEEKVLPRAGEQTPGQLRNSLRQAVIAVDPQGAERRREEAERRAKVSLYGDEDNTATLTGSGLPVVQAAAAMARITALARAVKASGAEGGINLHRAQVFLGLLLGTLPFIPPAEGAPPDIPPPEEGGPGEGGPGEGGPGEGGPGEGGVRQGDSRQGDSRHEGSKPAAEVPVPDAPHDEGDPYPDGCPVPSGYEDEDADGLTGPVPAWPSLPALLPPAFARSGAAPAVRTSRPPSGLLDLALPWSVLTGLSSDPGHLGRLGPITASQARQLAKVASADPATQWRVILANSAGQALAVARVPRRGQARDEPGSRERDGPLPGSGLVGRVTLVIGEDALAAWLDRRVGSPGERTSPVDHEVDGILTAVLRTAARAGARVREHTQADADAGGCAHRNRSEAYRPPPRLQEHVTARDLTCRFPSCRQPAWRSDLDHTVPWPAGPTCECNLGGVCRCHHQLKQHRDWNLSQRGPGTFVWTTPSGRSYTAIPDIHT